MAYNCSAVSAKKRPLQCFEHERAARTSNTAFQVQTRVFLATRTTFSQVRLGVSNLSMKELHYCSTLVQERGYSEPRKIVSTMLLGVSVDNVYHVDDERNNGSN